MPQPLRREQSRSLVLVSEVKLGRNSEVNPRNINHENKMMWRGAEYAYYTVFVGHLFLRCVQSNIVVQR